MKIKIDNHFTTSGKEYFRFELWDGPDGIEHVQGFAIDLIETFSKILEWRERIGADYVADVTADMNTLENFSENDETD